MAGAYSISSQRFTRNNLQSLSHVSVITAWERFAHTQIIENVSGSAPGVSNSAAALYLTTGILNRVDAVSGAQAAINLQKLLAFNAAGHSTALFLLDVTSVDNVVEIAGASPAASNSSAGLYLTSGILNRVDAVSGSELTVSLDKLLTGTVLASTNGSFILRLNKLQVIAGISAAVSDARLKVSGIPAVKIKVVLLSGSARSSESVTGKADRTIIIGGTI